jgi:tRNA(Arg) A34 adenosine deaminase TadA
VTHSDRLVITIPPFVDELVQNAGALKDDAAFVRLAIALSRENVEQGGAPFGAVVAAGERVVAGGVNRVLASGMSIAHAEIVTLMRAQLILQNMQVEGPLTLYTSTEPCCQCYGAVVWSGVSRLVCGATTADAEAIGFDEGPKPEHWQAELERRGISVTQAVCVADARAVLQLYVARGGRIFGSGAPPANPGA